MARAARKRAKSAPAAQAAGPRQHTPVVLAAGALIVIGAALLRWPGLGTDLWLDELWARRMAIAMPSALDAFTLHHEVNHHLMTIWLYLTGPDASAEVYRLPSFAAGLAAIAVAGLIGWRRNAATAAFAMLLAAASYELIVFSSEARGYSLAVSCTLLSVLLLEVHFERPRRWTAVAYSLVAALGLLTQPVFSTVLASACVWSLARWWTQRPRSLDSALATLGPQLLPVAGLAAVYFGDLRHVVSGGGTGVTSLAEVYGRSLAWALGAPDVPAFAATGTALAILALLTGLRLVLKRAPESAAFYLGAIVVFPNLAVLVRGSEIVYTRHFLLGSVLLLLLLAFQLGAWWQRGGLARAIAIVAVGAFTLANSLHYRTFLDRGRGGYQEAIQFMADRASGPMTIAADHDFRVGLELDYYLKRVVGSRPAQFVRDGAWPASGPTWLVANADHYEPPTLPHNVYADSLGHEYEYVRTFPTAPLTGLHWFLFRNRAAR